jgi:hypothetical protein
VKPARTLSVTDRCRLKELELQQAGTVPAGRVMWCRGRQVLGYADIGELVNVFAIPKGANTYQAIEAAPSPQLAFEELERSAREQDVVLAKRDPRAHRSVRVFDPGVEASYRYVAVKAKGRATVRFCWTVNRNAAGRFLVFRETVTARGIRRDCFEAVLDKRAAIGACRLYKADLIADRAKAEEKARRRRLVIAAIDPAEIWDEAMRVLSRLSIAAQAIGDDRSMYAANRAWRELDRAGRPARVIPKDLAS